MENTLLFILTILIFLSLAVVILFFGYLTLEVRHIKKTLDSIGKKGDPK